MQQIFISSASVVVENNKRSQLMCFRIMYPERFTNISLKLNDTSSGLIPFVIRKFETKLFKIDFLSFTSRNEITTEKLKPKT